MPVSPGATPSAQNEAFADHYGMSLATPGMARPTVRFCRPGEGAARRLAGRLRSRGGRRRLAYVDTHFPWQRSGFRYDEALALHELRPDTLFFALWPLTDPFPAPVHALADFPRRATTAGVTDVYAVFLDCVAGLVGESPPTGDEEPPPMVAPDLSSVLRRNGVSVHAGLYPGGGLVHGPERLAQARRVAGKVATVFTWVHELEGMEHVVMVPPAIVNTAFYAPATRDWERGPLRVLFAADASPRKGLDVLLAAVDRLDDRFAFDVVGPHEAQAATLAHPERVTFHGWQEPEQLRERFAATHVFACPVRPQMLEDGEMIDGFPTTTGGSAMSTGALLVAGNPRGEHGVLTPGVTHVELDPVDVDGLVAALDRIERDRRWARDVARAGARTVRARLDVRASMRERLERIGLVDPSEGR